MRTAIDGFQDSRDIGAVSIVLVTALPGSENDHQMFIDLVALAASGRRVFLVTNDNDLLRYWRPLDPERPGVVVYTSAANKAVALHHAPGSPEHMLRIDASLGCFRNHYRTAEAKLVYCTGNLADKYQLLVAAKAAEATQMEIVRPLQAHVDDCVVRGPRGCERVALLQFRNLFSLL